MKQLLVLFGLLFSVLSKSVWAKEIYTSDINHDGMIVPISIDGEVYRFLVGSIFSDHIINERVALEQQWNDIELSTDALSEPHEDLYAPPDKLNVGDSRVVLSEPFVSMSDEFFRKFFGDRVHGILGAEFFNQFLWDIDGPDKTFRILTKPDKRFASFVPDFSFLCRFKGIPSCDVNGATFDMDIGNASNMDVVLPLVWVQEVFSQGLYNLTHIQEGYTGTEVIESAHGFVPRMLFNGYLIKNFAITSGSPGRITFSFLSRGRTLINPRSGLVQTAGQKERKPYVPISLGLDLIKTESGHLIYGKKQGCHLNLKNFEIGDYIDSVRPYHEGIYAVLTEPRETLPAVYHSDDLPIVVTGSKDEKPVSELVHMAPACIPRITW